MRNIPSLRNREEFDAVYQKHCSYADSNLIVYCADGSGKIGIVCSKKVGNSVQRNRSRRLMKEAWRAIGADAASGYDIVFVARASINGRKEPEVEKCMRKVAADCGLI